MAPHRVSALAQTPQKGTAPGVLAAGSYSYAAIYEWVDANGTPLGYPRRVLEALHDRAPDVLHRPYWRQLSPHSFEERKRLDDWW